MCPGPLGSCCIGGEGRVGGGWGPLPGVGRYSLGPGGMGGTGICDGPPLGTLPPRGGN